MKKALVSAIVLMLLSCSMKKKSENFSDDFERGKKLAELNNKNLKEVSGLAASINNPRLLWALNDSGNGAEIFLLDEQLKIKLRCTLAGVENRDWEDITTGPGPDPKKNYVYVAEIGDNDAIYQYKHIYRFEEPIWKAGEANEITISTFDTITFQLSDTRKDTEALLLDPATRNLYVISKREEPVYLYELKYPYSTTDTLVAEKLISLPFSKIVAADFSPDGKEILMKNYDHVYHWRFSSTTKVTDALKATPVEIPYEVEPQGESIAWATDGSGFYTLSEQNKKHKTYLYFYKRKGSL